jgi:uncharacterized protein (TIGR03083 family)
MRIDGLSIDREKALAAVAAVGERTADVIGAIGDLDGRTRGLEWTLGQTAAHIVGDVQYHRAWLQGEGKIDYFVPDLAEENLRGIESVKERDPMALAATVRQDNAAFVSEAAGQPAGAAFAEEVGPDLSLEVMISVHLGELLVHGWDIAATLGRPWAIERDEANIVARGVLPVLPMIVDRAAAARVSLSYELSLRGGGPRVFIRVHDGSLTVEPVASRAPVDCQISADPAAFLLVAYGRVGQLGPILRGQLIAWGRRPWAALRLNSFIRNP